MENNVLGIPENACAPGRRQAVVARLEKRAVACIRPGYGGACGVVDRVRPIGVAARAEEQHVLSTRCLDQRWCLDNAIVRRTIVVENGQGRPNRRDTIRCHFL